MKNYEFVRVGYSYSPIEAHRKYIREYAAKNYRYIGYIPTQTLGAGGILAIDLVFEKDTEETHGTEI